MADGRRPHGITAIAAFNVVAGGLFTVVAFGAPTPGDTALALACGAASVVVGSGLWRLRRWARGAAIGGYVINVLVGLATQNAVGVLLAVAILAYLLSPSVSEAFADMPPAGAEADAEQLPSARS